MTVKKTFPKILWLIISSSIFFIILYFTLFYYTKKAETQVYKDSVEHFDNEIHKLLDLESKPILVAINNDTNWDEFVDFTITKDKVWFDETIGNELAIYDAEYLGSYDAQKNFIMRTSTASIKSLDFIPKPAMDLLYKEGIKKFYLKIPEGIVEVTGAAIHPSNDPLKNKTKASGYFFVVRLINQEFLKNLSHITNSEIQLVGPSYNYSEEKNKISSVVQLKDSQGKIIADLLFQRNFEVYFENTINLLYIIIIAFLVILLMNLIYTRRLVYYPLYLVRRVLLTGNKKAIKLLKESNGEFSYIGNLFEENNNQKMELITAKIKAEESDRLKSSFLANLSHEIRTPMNAINGFTDLIINTDVNEAEKSEYLNVIEKSGKNLVSIIDDLIEMSKIDSNQIAPNYTLVNLESCVNELYETVKVTIQNKDLEFILIKSSMPAEFNIITDEIKLKQVLVNLLTNAIKFTDVGMVTFGYEIDEKNALIHFTVRDTGLGIDEEQHNNIFDRFKRVDSDISIKVGGLGLGLAISKAYVELLGGTITLESKVGEGSTFYVSIPLKYAEMEPITVSSVNNFEITKSDDKLILIAEDDNINFLLFQKMMQNKNYQIIRAVNGKETVEICLNNPSIDLVLMDIKMPIMNGFEAIERIQPVRPNLPIIAQTAYSSSEDKAKILDAGFTDYITKPLSRERLFELLTTYLEKRE
ncbi:response regulator [Flavobacterium sp. J49]|uniref:ATP-binding protein n=1 Tax=Flavobacterium sp. J49 TaxID=2718534 RepID=UPI00159396CD|nr:ATP-binding protein [Flavobacterium sp. J49]MBF6639939.1 response regulator [Flavobacterium sp. J49]NIC01184.1 response regulator [Flavobacterium sp. J49]